MIECPWIFGDVATVLDPDAGNHADLAGLFAAIHRAVPGEKQIAESDPVAVEDASLDAYEALAGRPENDWPLIIPVLGEPGTGKSHLVRWVWNQFGRVPDDSFAIVYIPRIRMNISGVMERLLAAALSDPNEEVRAAAEDLVKAARATYQDRDPDRVARELRAEVMFQLKSAASRRLELAEPDKKTPTTQVSNIAAALETILKEGADFEAYLHSDASAIGRRVAVLVEGRPEAMVHEAPAGFTIDELKSYSPLVAGQSRQFQDTVRRLVVHEEWGSLEIAESLLNEALDRAVSELLAKGTQGGGLTFTEVFRRLRESLYTAGRELVIFVEELKLLGGIERELLESFLDNRAAAGLAPICRVRALIACTTGEWKRLSQDIGTFTSRLQAWRAPQYTLDGGAALPSDEIAARLLDMTAHYLNAARVGVSDLESSFRTAPEPLEWAPPNACTTCAARPQCHPAFGVVTAPSGDIGLFPFNERALARAQDNAQQQQIHVPLAEGFNPRVLLNGVLAPTLKHLSHAQDGGFPNAPLARELGFAPATEATMRQALEASGLNDDEATRMAVLLQIWGEASPGSEQGLVEWTVGRAIAKGFGLDPPPAISTRPTTAPVREKTRPTPDESTETLPAAVDRWRNGAPLESTDRRNLRNRLNFLLMRCVEWNSFVGVSPQRLTDPRSDEILREAGLADPEKLIQFEESGDPPLPREESELVFEFGRDDADYSFLRVVATSASGDLQADELITLAEGLERRTVRIEQHLKERGIERGARLDADHPGVAALAVTTLAHGLDPGSTDTANAAQFLAGFIADDDTVPAKTSLKETQELFELLNHGVRASRDDVLLRGDEFVVRSQVRSWLLRRIGLRLSASPAEREQIQLLDIVAIYDAILNFASSTRLAPTGVRKANVSRGESSAMERLARLTIDKVSTAFQHEAERSRSVVASIRPLIGLEGRTFSPKELVEAVEAACEAAATADALVRSEAMLPPGEIAGSYLKYADVFNKVQSSIAKERVAKALIDLASANPTEIDRPIAAALFARFSEVNSYREAAAVALTRAETYLEYLPEHIRSRQQTASNPIIEGFPQQYRTLLDELAVILEQLGASKP